MAADDDSSKKVYKIVLRDLGSLLRKKLGKDVRVVDYSTESLLKLGENYGSTILKVQAYVEVKDEDGKTAIRDLHLVAKMQPPTAYQRLLFDSPYTFRKEMFLYEQLIPAYRSLEREFGVPEDELFDIVAEYYGARTSMLVDADIFDDDAVILMQNLKVQGYYMADRRKGLNLAHARVSVSALARFHALGIATKQHRPDFFAVVKERSRCLDFKETFDDVMNFYKKLMRDDPVMGSHYPQIEAAMSIGVEKVWKAPPTEPWSTVIHADFWINNVMFRGDEATGCVQDVKFVDFQNFLFLSPLRELVFFLTTNPSPEVMDRNFDELVDCYYNTFVGVLKRMRCETESFTRDKFDARLRIDAYQEFSHCPVMLKIMTADVVDESKVNNVKTLIMEDQVSSLLLERLRSCIGKFVEKGWLCNESEDRCEK